MINPPTLLLKVYPKYLKARAQLDICITNSIIELELSQPVTDRQMIKLYVVLYTEWNINLKRKISRHMSQHDIHNKAVPQYKNVTIHSCEAIKVANS